jgi:hypothetical protein
MDVGVFTLIGNNIPIGNNGRSLPRRRRKTSPASISTARSLTGQGATMNSCAHIPQAAA